MPGRDQGRRFAGGAARARAGAPSQPRRQPMTSRTEAEPSPNQSVLADLDRRTPTKFYWYLAALACVGGFLFGYDTADIGSALSFIPYHLSSFATGYLVAGASLGAAAGALVAGPLTDHFGRKSLLITDAAIYAVGAILSAVAVNTIMLLGARTLIGLAVGADSAIATAYIAEFAPRNRRGQLSIIQQWMITVGILVSYLVALLILTGVAHLRQWRGLEAHPGPRSGSGGRRARAAGPDARVPQMADAAQSVRRHQQGAGNAGDGGLRTAGAGGGRRACPDGAAAPAENPVDPWCQAGAGGGLRLLHLPADHGNQHPVLLRPEGVGDLLPGRESHPGQRGRRRRRGHGHPGRRQRSRDLIKRDVDS